MFFNRFRYDATDEPAGSDKWFYLHRHLGPIEDVPLVDLLQKPYKIGEYMDLYNKLMSSPIADLYI